MQPHHQPTSAGSGAPRRSLMNPFGPYQPPLTSFPQYSMAAESSSSRSYTPQQMPGRYWQSTGAMEPATSSYSKPSRHEDGSLGMGEFSEILDTRGGNAALSQGSDANLTSFQVNSFQDGMTVAGSGSDGFHASGINTKPPIMTMETPRRHRKPSKSFAVPTDEITRQLVDAAYTRLGEAKDDLKTKKIEKDYSQRCQFDGCPNRARVTQSYGNFCNRHVIVAPCGFPGCREKAMERAAICVKHMELGKEALQEILNARSQGVPVCRTDGCFKNDQGRGYCRGHEKLMMATNRLPVHVNKRRLNSAYTMCSYPECTKHSQRHHLCRTHGNLVTKQAREVADRPGATESYDEILNRMQKEIRRCTHDNCTKNSQRDRLCTVHFSEKHKLQKDGSALMDGASVVNTALRNEQLGSIQLGAGSSHGSDVGTVEGTRCGKAGCGNLSYAAGLCVEHTKEHQDLIQSQGRFGDPYSTGASSGMLTTGTSTETEEKPVFQNLSSKQQGVFTSAAMASSMNTVSPSCSNPMCGRESYGRDYCEACQKLFSPLVVSIDEISSGSHGYAFNSTSAPIVQPDEKISLCRVISCGQESVTGGLCVTHFRAFELGSLSVDQVKLDSQVQQRQQKLAVAATATEAKQAVPAVGKARKYYCKVQECDKQVQKHNLCKRHFREQDGISAGIPQPESGPSGLSSDFVPGIQPPGPVQPLLVCRFPGCSHVTHTGVVLCLAHCKATFCWQPGCENLVEHEQFCDFHAFRNQCAFEGCLYTAQPNQSGCIHHAAASRCRHEYCGKFAAGSNGDWCRLHQISCQGSPCVLCQLHALSLGDDENSSRSHYNANLGGLGARGMPNDGFSDGSAFGRNPRLM